MQNQLQNTIVEMNLALFIFSILVIGLIFGIIKAFAYFNNKNKAINNFNFESDEYLY